MSITSAAPPARHDRESPSPWTSRDCATRRATAKCRGLDSRPDPPHARIMARRKAMQTHDAPDPELQPAPLGAEPPAGDDWMHEQKFDGYRILAQLDRG